MRVEHFATYEGWEQRSFRHRSGITGRLFRAALRSFEFLSPQTVRGDVTDFVMVASR